VFRDFSLPDIFSLWQSPPDSRTFLNFPRKSHPDIFPLLESQLRRYPLSWTFPVQTFPFTWTRQSHQIFPISRTARYRTFPRFQTFPSPNIALFWIVPFRTFPLLHIPLPDISPLPRLAPPGYFPPWCSKPGGPEELSKGLMLLCPGSTGRDYRTSW